LRRSFMRNAVLVAIAVLVIGLSWSVIAEAG
jgi:hypothetical protein